MKIIPKLARGGYASLFSQYDIIGPATSKQSGGSSSSSSGSSSKKGSSDELTEKDMAKLIDNLDGLPNEMQALSRALMGMLQMLNLTGISSSSLATLYVQFRHLLQLAKQNKEVFDNALKTAQTNGALAEPAISLDGRLVVLDNKGAITYVTLDELKKNQGNYHVLSNSQLANMRKYDPSLQLNYQAIDIVQNGVGYQSFLKLIKEGVSMLGSSTVEQTGLVGDAAKGLEQLQKMSPEKRVEYLQGVLLKTVKLTTQTDLIKSLIEYLMGVLPLNLKTWAAFKTGSTDANLATAELITRYLLSKSSPSITETYNFDKLLSANKGSSGSKSGSTQEPNKGVWALLLAGLSGTDSSFLVIKENGNTIAVNGKYYGSLPKLEDDLSLLTYLNSSGVGNIIKNRSAITFGNVRIDPLSLFGIMIDSSKGAMRAILPINEDGSVNTDLVDVYEDIKANLKAQGLNEDSAEWNVRMGELLKENNLNALIDEKTGLPNPKYFGAFLIVDGMASSKVKGLDGVKKKSLNDFDNKFYTETKSDEDTNRYKGKLSTKDNPRDWLPGFFGSLYKGTIFIPLNTNPNNGYNADSNNLKESQVLDNENAEQNLQRVYDNDSVSVETSADVL